MMDKGKTTGFSYLDLSAAFEITDHQVLLHQLDQ